MKRLYANYILILNVLIACLLVAACSNRIKRNAAKEMLATDTVTADAKKLEDMLFEERNMIEVFINRNDQLMAKGDYITISQLKDRAIEFISNPYNEDDLPEKTSQNLPYFNDIMVTKSIICVRKDVKTSDDAYQKVINEVKAAYEQLYNELASEKFGKTFAECALDEQQAIKSVYPMRIVESVFNNE